MEVAKDPSIFSTLHQHWNTIIQSNDGLFVISTEGKYCESGLADHTSVDSVAF